MDPEDPTTWQSTDNGYVGKTADGGITVSSGAVLPSSSGYVGDEAAATGTATITGTGSHWNNSGALSIGRFGDGILNVEDGGLVTSAAGLLGVEVGATGAAIVSGSGSQWSSDHYLYVGFAGDGALTVADGGEVTTATLWASLDDLHGNGTIIATEGAVLDADLRFDASGGTQAIATFGTGGTLSVTANGGTLGAGYKSWGSLTIADGVEVTSSSGHIGRWPEAMGIATVTGTDSHWTIQSDMFYIGGGGNGALNVEAGGTVTSTISYIGGGSRSTGVATITGSGSQWNSNRLYIGRFGSGSLNVKEGGLVTSKSGEVGPTSTVTITGSGSEWSMVDGLILRGPLNVEAGGRISSESGFLSSTSAKVIGSGSAWSLLEELDVDGSLSIARGGLVTVAGELSTNHGAYLNMTTGGMLALFGEADDSITQFLNLFQGTDAIRYWSADLVDWAPITDATYGDDYTLEYLTTGDLAGYTVLTVGEVPTSTPGDFNNDGVVNLADYALWRNNLGAADDVVINNAGDGLPGVDSADYEVWKLHFGESDSAGVEAARVPEPGGVVLLIAMLSTLACVARR